MVGAGAVVLVLPGAEVGVLFGAPLGLVVVAPPATLPPMVWALVVGGDAECPAAPQELIRTAPAHARTILYGFILYVYHSI